MTGPESAAARTATTADGYPASLLNEDLRPVAPQDRTWSSRVYLTLWVAMCMNAATWTLAASLIAIGMNWLQALMTILLANLIVLVPMLLTSHAGAKHGISFPVVCRASYGIRGVNLPAVMRGLVACGWFGIQTWFGGLALNLALGTLIGASWSDVAPVDLGIVGTLPVTTLACYLVCAAIQLVILYRGFESLRRFQAVAAPLVMISATLMLVILLVLARGDLGPVVTQPSRLGWGSDFWLKTFPPSLMANIAFWSTLSLNMPDFTRFAESQKAQRRGQAWGLPVTMLVVSLIAVLTTSVAAGYYQVDPATLWNPDALVSHFGNKVAIVYGALVIVISSFQTNTAANLVSPALDFANALPRYITFKRGALLAVVIGTLFLPWRLLSSPDVYIFVWLGFYGGILGAVGGVMIADYWLFRKTHLTVPDLFRFNGRYHYLNGWNIKALVATVAGGFFAVGGAYSALAADGSRTGPFPPEGIIPLLRPLYDYNWVVSFLVGMLVYWLLSRAGRPESVTTPFEEHWVNADDHAHLESGLAGTDR